MYLARWVCGGTHWAKPRFPERRNPLSRASAAYLARGVNLSGRPVVEPWQVISSLVCDLWHHQTQTALGSSGTEALREPANEERAITAATATTSWRAFICRLIPVSVLRLHDARTAHGLPRGIAPLTGVGCTCLSGSWTRSKRRARSRIGCLIARCSRGSPRRRRTRR